MVPVVLRSALAANLGRVLTPEIAALIEAHALFNPMPVPQTGGSPRLDNSQSAVFFDGVNESIGCALDIANARSLVGVDTTGQKRAVVAFHNPRRQSVDVTVVSDESSHWLSRDLIRASWAYVFEQLDLPRCSAYVRADNVRSIRLCEHIGFKREGVQRYDTHDMVMFGALRSQCRWLKGKL